MLTEKAKKIFDLKYTAFKGELWEQACWRIASYIASAEDVERRNQKASEFFELIYHSHFLPGGRILANAGTSIKNLNNCFVLPIEDSRESIYDTLKKAAEVFAWGGGVGYDFSHIREEGAEVKTTGGKASGPLSFMSLFDQTGEVISQASRRGAQMGMLSVYHKDIEKFINFKSTPNSRNSRLLKEYKRNLELSSLDRDGHAYFDILEKTLQDDQLSHFNLSVIVDDKFMENAKSGTREGELLSQMARMAWESGDPGIFFFDRTNEDNLVPYLGDLECTNPCGEVPLLPYEPCCLGSINLHSFYVEKTNSINFPFLEYVVRTATRFLDNVQTLTETPVEEINTWSRGLRRIGLGVMGFADLLAELELPYDSEEAKNLGKYLGWFISFFSILESISLAQERGAFPMYNPNKVNLEMVDRILHSEFNPGGKFNMDEIRQVGLRNVSVTSIAPTGTIALIADVNSGIEPFFALSYKRNITEGVGNIAKDFIVELNPILERKLIKYGYSTSEIKEIKSHVKRVGSLDGLEILEKVKRIFSISHEISPYAHVDMQSSWQSYITNAVSKTINCPENTPIDMIFDIYKYMWNMNLKGGTIYRDRSKTFQILNLPQNGS